MNTVTEIMMLVGAFADAEDADFALHTLDELRTVVTSLVAERDLAIHEQDGAQGSLRQHQVWLQEVQAENAALKAESLLWSRRAGEDVDALRAVIDERDALRAALLEVLEFQSDPKAPTIHDFGRWRRLAQPSKAGEPK